MTVPNIYPSYITDGANPPVELSGGVSDPFPTGIIIFHSSATIPSGWLACSGTSVSKTTYANLYSVLGANAFGTDTSTDFFLPNFIDLFPIGVSGTKSLNATGGSTTHVHGNVAISATTSSESLDHDHTTTFGNPDHSHSNSNATVSNANDGDHNHGINGANTAGATANTTATTGTGVGTVGSHTHGINAPSTNGGGGVAHNWNGMSTGNIASGVTSHNHTITSTSVTSHTHTGSHPTSASTSGTHTPPFLVVQFIIKT
jgi:microcystin-dependent protein